VAWLILKATVEGDIKKNRRLGRHCHAQPEAALEICNLVKTKTPKVELLRYSAREPSSLTPSCQCR
jgi:hypothetical protein